MLYYIFILNREILSVKEYIKICWQNIFCKYKNYFISSFVLALSLSKLILRWVSGKKIVFVSHEVNSQDEHYLSNETEQAPHVNRSYREVKELTEAVFLETSLDRLHE